MPRYSEERRWAHRHLRLHPSHPRGKRGILRHNCDGRCQSKKRARSERAYRKGVSELRPETILRHEIRDEIAPPNIRLETTSHLARRGSKKKRKSPITGLLAEVTGFEPAALVKEQLLSREPHSASLAHLQANALRETIAQAEDRGAKHPPRQTRETPLPKTEEGSNAL